MSRPKVGKLATRQIDTTGMSPAELAEELSSLWDDYCAQNFCRVSVPEVGSEVWDGPVLVTRRRVEYVNLG